MIFYCINFAKEFILKLHTKYIFFLILCLIVFDTTFGFISSGVDAMDLSDVSSVYYGSVSSDTNDNSDVLDCGGAKSCALMDANSGLLLYEKDAFLKVYPASTTKIVTALLVLEKCNLSDIVPVSHYAVYSVPPTYSIASIRPYEKFTVKSLLYTLMVGSANDSAFALAQYIGSDGSYPLDNSEISKKAFDDAISSFSGMMNDFARNLGCKSTNFVNPNGIHNENHVSCAYDLALIGRCAYENSTLMSIVSSHQYVLPNTDIYMDKERVCRCTNLLLYNNLPSFYEFANGLKTGYTDAAGYCIVASAKKGDSDLIAVVLGATNTTDENTSREAICKRLFEYGFNTFSYSPLINAGDVVTSFTVINGNFDTKSLDLIAKDDIIALLKNR